MDSGTVSMALAFCILLSTQFNLVIVWLASTELELVSVERVKQYFQNETEDLKKKICIAKTDDNLSQTNRTSNYENYSVIFENVSLTYQKNEETFQNEPKLFALKKLNLWIKKGEKIAICGR